MRASVNRALRAYLYAKLGFVFDCVCVHMYGLLSYTFTFDKLRRLLCLHWLVPILLHFHIHLPAIYLLPLSNHFLTLSIFTLIYMGILPFFLVYSRQCLRWIVYVCQPMLSTCACLRAYSTYVCIVVIFLQATHTPDIRRSMKKQDGCLTKFIWRFAVQCVRLALNLKKNHFYKNVAAHFNRMKL